MAVTGTDLSAHAVMPPIPLDCEGGGLFAPLTYSWPSKDARYTYRVQVVDATSTVRWTDEIPEPGQTNCSITDAAGDLPNGNFTGARQLVPDRVDRVDLLNRHTRHRQQGIRAAARDHLWVVLVALDEVMTWKTSST